MKILVSLNNNKIKDYLNYTNSFILGLKKFSVNYKEFSIEEIKKIKEENPNCELFISVNKNMFNKDLQELEEKLMELTKIKVDGVLFYDLSILSIVKRLNLDLPLIWHQEHMVTNYNTCNYYYSEGCEYAYIASDITTEEILEIHEKSKIKLIAFTFGYPAVSFSKRKMITNYFIYKNKENEVKKEYYAIKNNDIPEYFIKECEHGTSILYGNLLNGIEPLDKLKNVLDYAVLDEQLVDHKLFLDVLEVYKQFIEEKLTMEDANLKIKNLTSSDDTVFYNRKTIYKVKHEK